MYPHHSLGDLCALFGVTRQAYYEAEQRDRKTAVAHMIVLCLIKEICDEMPMLGIRKLLCKLSSHLHEHGIKMGRDKLFDLLRFHGLLVRKRKRMARTTNSNHWLKQIS